MYTPRLASRVSAGDGVGLGLVYEYGMHFGMHTSLYMHASRVMYVAWHVPIAYMCNAGVWAMDEVMPGWGTATSQLGLG